MRNKSKWLVFLLCATFLVSFITGCGTTPATPAATSSAASAVSSAPASTPAAPAVKAEISYMNWYNNETEPAETQKVFDKFNSSQDGITAKLISVAYADYDTKLNTMASSNTLPDSAYMLEANVIKWAKTGKCADLSDMYTDAEKPLDSLAYTYQGKPVAYSSANEVLLLYY